MNLRKNLIRENAIMLVMLFISAAACVFLWYLGTMYFVNRVDIVVLTSTDGTYDLSGIDFEDSVVRIIGDVEFIENELLTPKEFEARSAAGETRFGAPQQISNVSTSRIRLYFEDTAWQEDTTRQEDASRQEDAAIALACHSIDFAHSIYINGTLYGSAGQPGLTKETEQAGYAFWKFTAAPQELSAAPQDSYAINQNAPVIEIVQQASNFVHRESSGHTSIYIGSVDNIDLYAALNREFDAITVGLFFALFLVHLALYLVLRTYRANIYLAALCLTWAVRSGVVNTKVFSATLPFLSWEAAFRLEYLAIPLGIILVVLIISEIFPIVSHKWTVRVIIGIAAAFGVLFLFADTLFMSHSLIWCSAFYVLVIVWLVVRFCMKLPAMLKEYALLPEHRVSLIGLGVFCYAAIHDAFYYNNIYLFGLNRPVADVSMLIFAFSQMISMSRSTMREFYDAREAEKKLKSEKAQLETKLRKALSTPVHRTIIKGSLMLDTVAQKAFIDDTDMRLSPKEFSILSFLLTREGETINAKQIYEEVWKQPMIGDSRALQARASTLRKKLAGSGYDLINVYGHGYCLQSREQE